MISTGEWERALGCIPPQSSRRTAASLPVAFGLARSFSLACFSSRSQRTAAARYLSHSLPFPSLIETTSTTTMSAGPFNELVEETWTRVQELMSSTDGWAPISTVRARWLFVVDWSARALDRVQRHFSLTVWCTSVSIGVGVWRRHFRSRRTCKTATFESCLAPRSRYEVCVHTSRERERSLS